VGRLWIVGSVDRKISNTVTFLARLQFVTYVLSLGPIKHPVTAKKISLLENVANVHAKSKVVILHKMLRRRENHMIQIEKQPF
jgi:hypothetical protein